MGGCFRRDPCWPEMFPAGFAAGGRSASGLARRPPTAEPVPPAGRSDLTAFLSSDIFPHQWLKFRKIGHGLKKIWEDVPEGILVGRRCFRPVSRPGGRSDLTAFLSSDIFPHRWLKVRKIGHGLKKIWEDVPEVILVGRRCFRPVSRPGGRSASGLARRPPTAKPVPPAGRSADSVCS